MASSQRRVHGAPDIVQVELPLDLEVLAWSKDPEALIKPCVDCGQRTGSYCDYCRAVDRDPKGVWEKGQHTPLCTRCGGLHARCLFCRGMHWATPPSWGR